MEPFADTVPPPSHGWSFSTINNEMDPNYKDFLILFGCYWDRNNNTSTRLFNTFFRYNSKTSSFSSLNLPIPNTNDNRLTSTRYRHATILREFINPQTSKQEQELVVFGGVSPRFVQFNDAVGLIEVYSNDCIKYNFTTKEWSVVEFEKHNELVGIAFHSLLYRKKTDEMILCFGKNQEGTRKNDMLIFQFKDMKYRKIQYNEEEPIPKERGGQSFLFLNEKDQNEVIVYGGIDNDGQEITSILKFDLRKERWSIIPQQEPIPKGRASHASFIHKGRWLFCFGGASSGAVFSEKFHLFDDLNVFNFETHCWKTIELKIEIPQEQSIMMPQNKFVLRRYLHGGMLIHDINEVSLMIFGGISSEGKSTNDLFKIILDKDEFLCPNSLQFFKKNMLLNSSFQDCIIECWS